MTGSLGATFHISPWLILDSSYLYPFISLNLVGDTGGWEYYNGTKVACFYDCDEIKLFSIDSLFEMDFFLLKIFLNFSFYCVDPFECWEIVENEVVLGIFSRIL